MIMITDISQYQRLCYDHDNGHIAISKVMLWSWQRTYRNIKGYVMIMTKDILQYKMLYYDHDNGHIWHIKSYVMIMTTDILQPSVTNWSKIYTTGVHIHRPSPISCIFICSSVLWQTITKAATNWRSRVDGRTLYQLLWSHK